MIWFDATKSGQAGHHSGLMRVSSRLREELGTAATEVTGTAWASHVNSEDWWLTAEVFAPDEREDWSELLKNRPCRLAAIFHDAIPMKWPQITWPQSVARHPAYLKMLAKFDRVWAVSETSRRELISYWQWLGETKIPRVEVLALGADLDGRTPRGKSGGVSLPRLLCVGILEPRKNQEFLLDVAEKLWGDGLGFELHLVGRVNPHFGKPIVARIKALARSQKGLRYHEAVTDEVLTNLYAQTRAAVFPTRAEGCGLPLLESLWRGVPCIGSDLPVLRENAAAGGCVLVSTEDAEAWAKALRAVLTDDAWHRELTAGATGRALPTWEEAAKLIRGRLARGE